MPGWLVSLSWALLVVMLSKGALTVLFAALYHRARVWETPDLTPDGEVFAPSVTVIVPAFNERVSIRNCLTGMSAQTYSDMNVLIVDDGSTDDTSEVAEVVVKELERISPVRMMVIRKGNGGKASALNFGILHTPADIIICVDADSILLPDAVEKIITPFHDPTVGAVGGMVKVANRATFLGRQQAMEYISGLALQRAAFAHLNAVQVLSGAISAFRRDVVREFGGYSRDTIVEDFDITVAVQAAGRKVVLHPHATAFTEGPLNLRDLLRQRYRWTFGGFQVLAKYKHVLFTSQYGKLSLYGLPYFLIFPWFDVLVSLLFGVTFLYATATHQLSHFLMYFAGMSLFSLGFNSYAVKVTGDPVRLAFWGLLSPVFYAHLLTVTTARAGWGYFKSKPAKWDKLERGGNNTLELPPKPKDTP